MYTHQHQLKLALGLTESEAARMPPSLTRPPVLVDGVLVYIVATPDEPGYDGTGRHRVRAICPECGKHTSAGRMMMHRRVHGVHSRYRFYAEQVGESA